MVGRFSILATSMFWGCISISFFDEDVIETCGGERYRAREQICEDGILKNPCGNGYYDQKIQFCFDNAVLEKCTGKEYNPLNQECKSGIVLNKCGDGYYNPAMQFCFEQDNEIYNKCTDKDYNPLNQKCEGDILFSKCGDDYYNPSYQKCEDGILLSKCGNNYYNPLNQNQKCEGNALLSKCGNDYYNPSSREYRCEDDILLSRCGYYDYYNPLNQSQKCENGILLSKCGNIYYDPLNQSRKCENDTLLSKCGREYYNPNSSYQFCFDNVLYGICGNEVHNASTHFCDWRDSTLYKKIVIGNQIWMGENLNFSADGTVGMCYDDIASNCDIYGRLYPLSEAIKVCPSGWHLSNYEEWEALRGFMGSYSYAGTKLKANSDLWHPNEGTDNFGFAALPGGFYAVDYVDGSLRSRFVEIEETAFFWFYYQIPVLLYSLNTKGELKLMSMLSPTATSVRCVQD
jgi:uncharacterized protein (TIGR02145 family)